MNNELLCCGRNAAGRLPAGRSRPDAAPRRPPRPPRQRPGDGAQPVTLRLKFTPGQTLYYTLTTDTDGTMLTARPGRRCP